MKVGDRVSVVATAHGGGQIVVRALVRKHDRGGPRSAAFLCVRVVRREQHMSTLVPRDVELSARGISWARGWHSREADALRVSVVL